VFFRLDKVLEKKTPKFRGFQMHYFTKTTLETQRRSERIKE